MSEATGLSKLTNRAKEAEQRAADAAVQARTDLEKWVAESRATRRSAARLKATAASSKDDISSWWTSSSSRGTTT